MDSDHQPPFSGNVGAVLIAMASASFVVTMYHLILLCCNHQNHHITEPNSEQQQARFVPQARCTGENPLVPHLIPAHKYEKKKRNKDDVAEGDEDDDACAVCLGDFEEGEELRTLPECLHSFHVACIDMWLYSHSTCPVCRTHATMPSTTVPHQLPELGSGSLNIHHTIDIEQIPFVQNGLPGLGRR